MQNKIDSYRSSAYLYIYTLYNFFSLLLCIQVPRLVDMEPFMLIPVSSLSITDVCGVDQ